jgi:integrase
MIYKRGKIYWYKFMWKGELVRESTKQGSDKVARQIEAAHRTSLAKGEVGIRDKKPVPTLLEFIENRFEPWAKSRFQKSSPKTWAAYYRVGLSAIKEYRSLVGLPLDAITSETVADFAAHRHAAGMQISTVNSSLQVLRRALRLAVEWGAAESTPIVKMLPGARRRERVVTPQEEARYLACAPDALAAVTTVLVDTGLRPEECFRLRWESITWTNGRFGTMLVTHGKTAAARRVLPMTPRVKRILEDRWNSADKPDEGWMWPASTRSGHVEPSSFRKQHATTFKTIAKEAGKNDLKPVRPFVFYSLRHTFLTRLGESGCDAWTLARIAGHSSIGISARYVHPSEEAVLNAMTNLGQKQLANSADSGDESTVNRPLLTQ